MISQNEYQSESMTESILKFDSVNFKSLFIGQKEEKNNENDFNSDKIGLKKKNILNAKKMPHIKNFTLNMNVQQEKIYKFLN